ncbi:MAG: AsmA family protein [Acetobacteraceae bacterium]
MAADTALRPDVRRWRTVLVTVGAVTALLLLAVWQVPQWLDWTRYRTTIEVLATATLGQPVSISGPISLTLLPQPELTAAQVNIGGNGSADLSIRVQALRLRTAFWPLVAGRVDARELVLGGPDLHIPWPAQPGMLLPRPPAWLAAFAARIENGRLTIGRVAFTGINATLATLDTGALSASGTAQFTGQDWHFTARLTAAGRDGAAGLDVALDGQGVASGLGASFTGQLARDGTLAGTIASRGPNLAVLVPAPPVTFRADGRLTVNSGVAAVNDVAMEIGGSPARGAVVLRVTPDPRLDIALAASRLSLDAWLPVLLGAGTTIAGIDVPIGIDFSAEAAPLAGGALEHVKAALDLDGKELVVREANAFLPGSGQLRVSGHIARDDPARLLFEGDARFEAPLLRTTVRWLDQAVPGWLPPRLLAGLPESVAQRAKLSAHVVANNGDVALQHLSGTLDDAEISGGLRLKRGDPPSLTVDLSADRLALDSWLPARPATLAELYKESSGLDVDLRLNVRQALLAGVTIDGLVVDAVVGTSGILLRRTEGMARGARFAMSGALGDGGRLSGGKLSIEANDAAPLSELLPSVWRPTPALWHGPAKLEVEFAGPQQALAASARLALGNAELEVSPTIDLTSGLWSATLALHHPGARRLIAMLGLPERLGVPELPAWLDDGSLALVAHLTGAPGRFGAAPFDLTAATLHARGDLELDPSGAEPRATGHIRFGAVTLPLPNGGSNVPLPFGVLSGWRGNVELGFDQLIVGAGPALGDVAVTLSVASGALRLENFAAKLGSGTMNGSLAVDATADPPALAVDARLSNATITGPLDDAPIDLLSGRADATAQLRASGYSPSAILATLSGRGTLTVNDGALAGFDMFRLKLSVERPDLRTVEAAASDALRSGATGFDRLELGASVAHGDVVLESGVLTGIAGEAHVSGGMNLTNQALDVTIALQPSLPSPPEIAIHLTGSIDRPSATPELAGLARWMAQLIR